MDDNRPDDHPDQTSGGEPSPETNGAVPGPSADDLTKRLANLERELAETRAERDEYKASTYSLLGELFPFVPPTDEEIHDMMYGPRGQPIIEIIEELERKMGAGE